MTLERERKQIWEKLLKKKECYIYKDAKKDLHNLLISSATHIYIPTSCNLMCNSTIYNQNDPTTNKMKAPEQ